GAPLRHHAPRGVAPPLGARGDRRGTRDRQGPAGLSRGARVPGGAALVNPRVDRVREALEEPLLVSTPANIRYLTGFSSSNAAILVEPERLRVFSDFRYSATGKALEREGIEFIETNRNLYAGL